MQNKEFVKSLIYIPSPPLHGVRFFEPFRITSIRKQRGDSSDCHGPPRWVNQPPKVRTSTSEIAGKASSRMMRSRSDARNGITPLNVSVSGTSFARRLMM